MKPFTGRSAAPHIPGFDRNGVLQLIVACGSGFILYKLAWCSFIVFNHRALADALSGYVGLAPLSAFPHRWWTLFTYGFVHDGFWVWLSNMVWLYCFGNIFQGLVGYRQVIPLFIYAVLAGGLFGLGSEAIGLAGPVQNIGPVLSAQAGVTAMAAATLTLAPRYRFFLGEHFSFPLWVVVAVYALLNIVSYAGGHMLLLMIAIGGALTGFLYTRALQGGKQPGGWMYAMLDGANRAATPKPQPPKRRQEVLRYEARHGGVSQRRIDDILDKINQRGYESLTKEEKEVLQRASKGDAEKQ